MLEEYRCQHCNKLFFKGDVKHATIEIKCKNCKNISTVQGTNCKVWLLADKEEENQKNDSPHEDKHALFNNAIIQCESCTRNQNCESYHSIKGKSQCPLCKKDLKKV